MFRFLQGLVSLPVLNNTVFVYDNDAEGVYSYNRSSQLDLPQNIAVMKLPDCHQFFSFDTIGPNGIHRADINGKAAAIECYLDLGTNALIRWSNYHKDLNSYHGVLEYKDRYVEEFLQQAERVPGYDYTRIEMVLNALVKGVRSESSKDRPA